MIKFKLTAAVVALCVMSIISVGLLVYVIEGSHRMQDQVELRYRNLVSLIEFDRDVYATFMAAQHKFFNLHDHPQFDKETMKRDLELQVFELESQLLSTAEFLGSDNAEIVSEKATMFRLKKEIEAAFLELDAADVAYSQKKFQEAEEIAKYVLDLRIGGSFNEMLEAKIATERERIDYVRRGSRSFSHTTTRLTVIISILIIGIALWAIFTLLWQVQNGLDVLARGADRFAKGDLSHQIDLAPRDELGQLATVFNGMAAEFQSSQDALQAATNDLEEKIDTRTRELNQTNLELEERDERRRQFFADVGHELRTPVTAIKGQAEVALRSKNNHLEQRSEALQKIVSLTDQLIQDVSALFFIAREQAGVIDLRQEAVDLSSVVSQAAENMSAYFDKEQASVEVHSAKNVEHLIEGTESRLKQLVNILLTNAIAHSHTGVHIDVEVTGTAKRVHLTVSDDGPGIPFSERQRVFERFYRMATHSDSPVSGTGLGLPIARSLTLAHAGLIRVDESKHGGTEIRASFPRYQEDQV